MIFAYPFTLKNKNPLNNDCQININPFDKAETLNNHFAKISITENKPMLPDDDSETNFALNCTKLKYPNRMLKIRSICLI